MLITPQEGYYRAIISVGYAKIEFTWRTAGEAMRKALKYIGESCVY